jgi:hypothetical protein
LKQRETEKGAWRWSSPRKGNVDEVSRNSSKGDVIRSFRPKQNAFLYVCQDQVSHIK